MLQVTVKGWLNLRKTPVGGELRSTKWRAMKMDSPFGASSKGSAVEVITSRSFAVLALMQSLGRYQVIFR